MFNRYPFLLILPLLLLAAACSSSVSTVDHPRSPTGAPPLPADISSGRKAVIMESYEWMGVPYRYAGNTRRGVDCSGLVNAVFGKFGVTLPRRARDLFRKGRSVNRQSLSPGDLVFFSNTAGKGITHVGIYLGHDSFIHSSSSRGVIIFSLEDRYYRKHYAGGRMIIR